MQTSRKTERKRNSKAIRFFAKQLEEEVLTVFAREYGMGEFASTEAVEFIPEEPIETVDVHDEAPVDGTEVEIAEAEDEDDYGDEDFGDSFFSDPENIQSALEVAISSLMAAELVPELEDYEEAPSFSEVAGILFGEESERTQAAAKFEELISGYEDRALVEDLRQAFRILSEFVKGLQKKSRKGDGTTTTRE